MIEKNEGCTENIIPEIALNYILAGKWDVVGKGVWTKYKQDFSAISFEDRTDIHQAEKKLEGASVFGCESLVWKRYSSVNTVYEYAKQHPQEGKAAYSSLMATNDTSLYGEYNFFAPPIRKIIYNSSEPGSEDLSSIFFLDGLDSDKYCVESTELHQGSTTQCLDSNKYRVEYIIQKYDTEKDDSKNGSTPTLTEYRLEVKNIMLRLFSVGVVMLSFHTQAVRYKTYQYIENKWKKINREIPVEKNFCNCGSLGRRMFQPFINKDNNDCAETASYSCLLFHKNQAGKSDSSDAVHIPICYNMDAYDHIMHLHAPSIPFLRPNIPYASPHNRFAHPNCLCFLEMLFNKRCISYERAKEVVSKTTVENSIIISPFHDDRMYVHGYFYDTSPKGLPSVLKNAFPHRKNILSGCDVNSYWQNILIKWCAVTQLDKDCSATCCNLEMIAEQLDRDTYSRWTGVGTHYAITSTNFIMAINDASYPFLFDNMQWHYFQLFLIGLLQRCSVLRFCEEAAAIMSQSTRHKDVPKLCDSMRNQYIIFLNSIWWKEVSLQIQGQEMYKKLSLNMEIGDNIKQLDEALNELYDYNDGVYQGKVSGVLTLFSTASLIWAGVELIGFVYEGLTGKKIPLNQYIAHIPCLAKLNDRYPIIVTLLGCLLAGIVAYLISKLIYKVAGNSKNKKYQRKDIKDARSKSAHHSKSKKSLLGIFKH